MHHMGSQWNNPSLRDTLPPEASHKDCLYILLRGYWWRNFKEVSILSGVFDPNEPYVKGKDVLPIPSDCVPKLVTELNISLDQLWL